MNRKKFSKPWDKIKKKVFPKNFVEDKLIQLEKLNQTQRDFWRVFQAFLFQEREKRINEIYSALSSNCIKDVDIEGGRIVEAKYRNDPLNSEGSILWPPGGRFNLHRSGSYQHYFRALYLADSFKTAYVEKFYKSQEELEGKFNPENYLLLEPASFSFYKLKLFSPLAIDLGDNKALKAFFEVIKDIPLPKNYEIQASKLGIDASLIKNFDVLKKSIFDSDYGQWDTWLDLPSNSQWLGLYARGAGIPLIIYPSQRFEKGINFAVFPEVLKDSGGKLEIFEKDIDLPKDKIQL